MLGVFSEGTEFCLSRRLRSRWGLFKKAHDLGVICEVDVAVVVVGEQLFKPLMLSFLLAESLRDSDQTSDRTDAEEARRFVYCASDEGWVRPQELMAVCVMTRLSVGS